MARKNIDNDLIEKVNRKAQSLLQRMQPAGSRVQNHEDIAQAYFAYCFDPKHRVDPDNDEQMNRFMSLYIKTIREPYLNSIVNDISNNQSFDADDWYVENDEDESTDDDTTESTSRDAEESTNDAAKSITDDDVQNLIGKNVFVQTFEGIYVGILLKPNNNLNIMIKGIFSQNKDGQLENESLKEKEYCIPREDVKNLLELEEKVYNHLKQQIINNFKISIQKLIEYGDELKKIIQFNSILSAYEQFVFVNHLPNNAIAIKTINGPYNYYPTIKNTKKDTFIDNLTTKISLLDGNHKPLFWNRAKDVEKPKKNDIIKINDKYSEEIQNLSENSDISDSLEKYQKILCDVAKKNNPYEEMIFFNIPEVVDFIGKITESLSAMKEKDEYETHRQYVEHHNTVEKKCKRTRINEDKTFFDYANILNDTEKPSWLDGISWKKLCCDPLVQKIRTSNSPVTFTPEDIATTKARLKERYDIFCGNPRKKRRRKAPH